jgi:hypothetical protein
MPPFGSTAQVNSCPSTHTNTFIDAMSRTMTVCDQMDGIFPRQVSHLQIGPTNSGHDYKTARRQAQFALDFTTPDLYGRCS